jgi:hypothetical protein
MKYSFQVLPFYPPENSPWYPLYSRPGGLYGEEKNLLALPGIEPRFLGCSPSLDAMPSAI